MSAADASKSWPAIRRPFSIAWSQAVTVEPPAIIIERDATVGRPPGHLVAVALHEPHRAHRDAEPLRDHRRKGREMPLPDRLRAEPERDLAVGLEAQIRGVLQRTPARHLEEAADPEPAQLPGARRRRAPCSEPVPVGERERLVEHRLELAAVVDG